MQLLNDSNRIGVATGKGLYFFSPEEIIRLEASSNYTNIYLANKTKLLSARVLKEFMQVLEPFGFLRTHRSHLVNRQYILAVDLDGNILMQDSSTAEISRRMKRRVMQELKN